MKTYLDIVENTLYNGSWKNTRTELRALTTFGQVFRHDMESGFPLLTTKKMAVKTMWVELEGFIKGITHKDWYQKRGCNIWDEWSNPTNNDDYDLGPIYGYQWRRFNHAYDPDDDGCLIRYDQLKEIVNTLKTDPTSRRMVCSAWNPIQMDRMALPPCHVLWNVVVIGNKLNLIWHQRSCDLMLGVPFNIASYATLLLLLCKEGNLKPGILQGTFADCHIYENQIEGAKEQILRNPNPLPTVDVGNFPCIYDWNSSDTVLNNYKSHPKINFGSIAV
jgi:thymidylate synthase